MSTQELDVKRAWRAIRRGRRVVAAVAAVGMLGGLGVAVLMPPMHTAKSLVVLPPTSDSVSEIKTQVFIANSEPVLKNAGLRLNPPVTSQVLRERVEILSITQDVIEIRAHGTSAPQAIAMANAVAEVYLLFVTTDQKLPGNLGKKTGARMLEEAASATGSDLLPHLSLYGVLGLLAGALAGAVLALALARGDRRLRLRDEIADAVGIPVLASVSSYRARHLADWAYLLERYTPPAVDAWSLRKTLQHLGLDMRGGSPVSLSVITFDGDDKARTVGPQIAAFATSIGIPTSLMVDNQQEWTNALLSGDPDKPGLPAGAQRRVLADGIQPVDAKVALDIQLIIADRDDPHLTDLLRTTATIIGLSPGAVTAEELARLVVTAAADDRTIDGIVVTDADPSDRTTGRAPQSLHRSSARLPTLLTPASKRTTR